MRILWGAPLVLALLSTSALASETITYGYDALGRLVAVGHAGSINNGVQSSIAYDAADNRTNYSVSGVVNGALSISAASTTEGGNLVFIVSRSGPATAPETVDFATANGSAIAGTRYTATSGTLTFQPSDTSKTITVSTIDDGLIEGTQTMSVTLSNPTGGATLGTAMATGTINDNDAVQFAISNAPTVTEGGTLLYTVTRSGSMGGSYSVNYATANGSAVAGSDYNATSGTLTFGPSETTKTISVGTIDDSVPEPAETVLVNLSAPSGGATISTAQASGTINDNDVSPVSFAIVTAPTVTEGGTLVFAVTKSGSTYLTTSVNFATADGSANAGADYYATSGTLTFGPSDTVKYVSIGTIDDGWQEPAEVMYVNLSGANGGSISVGQASGAINDNDPAPISTTNPRLNYFSQQVVTIPISSLAVLNGRPGRIASFSPGSGSAVISGDGSSVTYTAPTIAKAPLCESGHVIDWSAPYTIVDSSTNTTTSGTATLEITGPDGGTPRPPTQCP